ncbi:hypothetical protein P5673_006598 [Acropora cervicornis]|uniref:Uncharacterized protein n=1 Tax=Acropora cervicornis TaxID=6130 RepID=A0AAD9QWA1_ACRCE|nr:hypothetical protein P5673_006598 [Acropora cervicornis]
MNLSLLVQAVIVYMKDHYPNTPKELNFHAELKAANHWCLSDDYKQLVVKKVPDGDCRLKIAVKETLKTWEKKEKDLSRRKTDEMKLLSDFREAIGVLKNYLKEVTLVARRKVGQKECPMVSLRITLVVTRKKNCETVMIDVAVSPDFSAIDKEREKKYQVLVIEIYHLLQFPFLLERNYSKMDHQGKGSKKQMVMELFLRKGLNQRCVESLHVFNKPSP